MNKKRVVIIILCIVVLLVCAFIGNFAVNRYNDYRHIKKQCDKISQAFSVDIEQLTYNSKLSENREAEVYTDAEGNVYSFIDNQIISFMDMSGVEEVAEGQSKGKKEIRSIADGCMRYMAKSEEYIFEDLQYNEDTELYYVTYCKHKGDYMTTDKIYVYLSKSGDVVAAGNPNRGAFDDIEIQLPTSKEVEEFVEKKLKENEIKAVGYEVDSVSITKMNGEIKCAVSIMYQILESDEALAELYYMDLN